MPAGRVTGTAEIMLDTVFEDIGLSFTAWFLILLGTQNNGLRAVFAVDLI